jgi:endonuclease/exonuclease/phosphatase family metal-dependent hydrolase
MNEIMTGGFAARCSSFWPVRTIRVVDWNIERGLKLPAIVDFLSAQNADVLVLQEVDVNARRTARLNVAEEIARSLGMNYVFGREFEELPEGSTSSPAYTGQATLSRWPLKNARLIRFRRQSGFWHPRWYIPNARPFQTRLGGRIALVAEIRVPGRSLMVYNLHLESRGNDDLRLMQLKEVLTDASQFPAWNPILVAGDVNFDTMQGSPAGAILEAGFSDAIGLHGAATTPRRGLFGAGRSIDRTLIRGPIRGSAGRVSNWVQASDHYPLSLALEFI